MQLDVSFLSIQHLILSYLSILLIFAGCISLSHFFSLHPIFLVEEKSGSDRREERRSLFLLLCSKHASILILYDTLSLPDSSVSLFFTKNNSKIKRKQIDIFNLPIFFEMNCNDTHFSN
jgi:hypothetical protein